MKDDSAQSRRQFRKPARMRRRNRIQCMVKDVTYDAICALADQDEVSVSEMTRVMLEDYIRRCTS